MHTSDDARRQTEDYAPVERLSDDEGCPCDISAVLRANIPIGYRHLNQEEKRTKPELFYVMIKASFWRVPTEKVTILL